MNAPLAKEQIALLMSDSLTLRTPVHPGMEGAQPETRTGSGIGALFRRLAAPLVDMARRRAVLDELSLLTDRELADVGLTRAELSNVFDPRFTQARGR